MNTSKVSYMSSSHLLKGFWSLPKVFMKPEADLQQLKGFIFGRKDVWQPIIYDLYDENYILYNSFRPFLSSSEVQNLQNLQGFCPGLHLASEDFLKIFASLSFFSSSDLHFFLERTEWPSKPKGQVHFSSFISFSFPSLCSLAPPCAEISEISENLNTIKRFFRRWRFDFGGFRFLSIGHVRYSVGFGWNDAKWKICRFFNVIGWLNGEWIHGRVSTPYIF